MVQRKIPEIEPCYRGPVQIKDCWPTLPGDYCVMTGYESAAPVYVTFDGKAWYGNYSEDWYWYYGSKPASLCDMNYYLYDQVVNRPHTLQERLAAHKKNKQNALDSTK